MFSQTKFLDFFSLYADCFKKNKRFWEPKIQWAPKWHPKSTKWRQHADISKKFSHFFLEPFSVMIC